MRGVASVAVVSFLTSLIPKSNTLNKLLNTWSSKCPVNSACG